ncbi:hypothetical protein JTE90_023297 [Oedothorax gibbosus]|uniref:Uncharacterized protein n=1 Tax=Oedothorax gibbosus TaxID=931172 RepID=A0AAV6UPA8_9ARAC|nr:hypothetical protein JTE90_023297 [Oedothorax gibbosus]
MKTFLNYYDEERDDDFNECDNEDVCNYYDEESDDVDFNENDDEYYNDFYDERYNDYDDERNYSYSDVESEPYDFDQYDGDEYLEMLDECELDSDDGDRDNFYSDSKLATYKYYLDIFVEYLLSKNPARKQKILSVNPAVNHEDELIACHRNKVNDSDVNIEPVFLNAGTCQKIIKNKNAQDCQNFIVLFESAVKGLMQDYCLNENTIKLALEDMIESYRNVQNGTIQTEIDFNNLNYTVGYLKRFALCHAAMVQEVILNILEAPPHELSSKLVRNQKLNLVCLGSGPGNDLVGFLSAFHCHFMKLTDLDITVVDRMSGWQVAFNRIIQLLKNEFHGNLSILFREGPNVTTSFIAEDLKSDALCFDLKLKLRGADMILLVKSLSHVPNKHKLQFLKNIVTCMKSGTLLFYIDCPFPTATFTAMSSLKSLYKTETQRYSFKRFGRQNISSCQASTHIFVKEN